MALADPQSVTIDGSAISLPRIKSAGNVTTYTSADGAYTFLVRQSTTKQRVRSEIRVSQTKIATDPLTALNLSVGDSVYLVVDRPLVGWTAADLKKQVDGLTAWTSASSGSNLLKVLQGES